MAVLDRLDRARGLRPEIAREPRRRLHVQRRDRVERPDAAQSEDRGELRFRRAVREGAKDPGLGGRTAESRECGVSIGQLQ